MNPLTMNLRQWKEIIAVHIRDMDFLR